MSVRYLRRPIKARVGRKAAMSAASAQYGNGRAAATIDVTSKEREQLAHALAYFCVACGREHATGEVRGCDVARAEADIIASIRRCP